MDSGIRIPALDSDATLRYVELTGTGYRLHTWDTYRTMQPFHKPRLGYALYAPEESDPIFVGEDFGCSPMAAIDSDETLRCILGFLTLRPGDTDDEWFDDYTDRQRAFCDSAAEYLSLWGMEDCADDCTFTDVGEGS